MRKSRSDRRGQKVRGALIYPMVILAAMFGIGVLMLTYILPKITSVFQDMDVKLPATTLAIIAFSDFLRNHYIIAFGGLFVLIVGVKVFASTEPGQNFFHWLYHGYCLPTPFCSGITLLHARYKSAASRHRKST